MNGKPAATHSPATSPLSGLDLERCFDLFLAAIRVQTAAVERSTERIATQNPIRSSPLPTVSPTWETVGEGVRGRPGGVRSEPPVTGVEPSALCVAAREAFVAPLLYAVWPELAASDRGEEVKAARLPPGCSTSRELLAPLYYANAARKAALLQLLEETADALETAGIDFLLLKGAALEVALGLPPALRVMADLDVLVPEAALAAAEQALAALGLVPTRDTENARLLRGRGYHLAPYVAIHGGAVELHRRLLPRSSPFRLPAADLWRESRPVPWRGRTLRIPSAKHLFLHTVIHSGFWHTHGTSVRRLWDLSLVHAGMALDRALLQEAARSCGARRLAEGGLWEVDALRTQELPVWRELGRRLRMSDELWTVHSSWDRVRGRSRSLDHAGQRLSLWRYAVLPAWEETANATGCASAMAHWGRFLHPRRVWRAVKVLRAKSGGK
jgi:Uncharacterised nucleotidyltransferase